MEQLTMQDSQHVGGGATYFLFVMPSSFPGFDLFRAIANGGADYAGLVEQNGHGYNMLGA